MNFFKTNFISNFFKNKKSSILHTVTNADGLLPLRSDAFHFLSAQVLRGAFPKEGIQSKYAHFDVLTESDVVTESNKVGQPFHIVNPSPYPFLLSIFFFFLFSFTICSLRSDFGTFGLHWFWLVGLASVLFGWFSEISYEEFLGNHTLEVQQGFRYGILLFILSELMLFVSFFWAYFHISLTHNIFTGSAFPPVGVVLMSWDGIPWINTLVLLSSGITLTLAHSHLISNDRRFRSYYWSQYFMNFLNNATIASSFFKPRVTSNISDPFFKFNNISNVSFSLPFLANDIYNRLNVSDFQIKNNQSLYSRFIEYASSGAFNFVFEKTALPAGSESFKSNLELSYTIALNEARSLKTLTPISSGFSLFGSSKTFGFTFVNELGFYSTFVWLSDVVVRGIVFLGLQTVEYVKSLFTIKTSAFGGCFFALTGLHCTHVIFGLVMLITCVVLSTRSYARKVDIYGSERTITGGYFAWGHRVGFDGVAWYWHFVDVVWFVLFTVVYWWPLQKPITDTPIYLFSNEI